MNSEQYVELDRRIKELNEKFDGITTLFNKTRVGLNQQRKREDSIPPGVACKVGYNSSGRITRTFDLDASDLPMIPMEKIIDLSEQMIAIENRIKNMQTSAIQKDDIRSTVAGTACKVNYDQNGHVLDGAGLNVDDIPELPLSKIIGLSEVLSTMKVPSVYPEEAEKKQIITPNTACKITYDQYGRVVRSDVLTMNDLPRELIAQINAVDGRVAECATMRSVNVLSEMVHKKISANTPIKPGKYTKVIVDSNGLVTMGDTLTEQDLPEINISTIKGLTSALRDKADRKTLLELSNTVNSITTSIGKINEVAHLKDQFDGKVDKKEFSELTTLVARLKEQVSQLVSAIPADTITQEFDQITSDITSITGRLSVIENVLHIDHHV